MLIKNNTHQLVNRVWQEHEKAINRALYSYEADQNLREDLAQEVFIALMHSQQHLSRADNPKSYVFRIVHNVAADHIAKQTKQKAFTTAPASLVTLADDNALATNQQSLDDAMQISQQQQLLLKAVRALKLPYRQVMILVLEELNSQEISDILKINSGTVRVRINRAKQQLKEALTDVIDR